MHWMTMVNRPICKGLENENVERKDARRNFVGFFFDFEISKWAARHTMYRSIGIHSVQSWYSNHVYKTISKPIVIQLSIQTHLWIVVNRHTTFSESLAFSVQSMKKKIGESFIVQVKSQKEIMFKVLKHNQTLMAWLGIHSYRLTETNNEFFKSFGTYYILFSIVSVFMISSAYTALFSFEFQTVIQAWLLVVAGLQSGGMFLSIGLQMKKIKMLQSKLQEIVNKGNQLLYV